MNMGLLCYVVGWMQVFTLCQTCQSPRFEQRVSRTTGPPPLPSCPHSLGHSLQQGVQAGQRDVRQAELRRPLVRRTRWEGLVKCPRGILSIYLIMYLVIHTSVAVTHSLSLMAEVVGHLPIVIWISIWISCWLSMWESWTRFPDSTSKLFVHVFHSMTICRPIHFIVIVNLLFSLNVLPRKRR